MYLMAAVAREGSSKHGTTSKTSSSTTSTAMACGSSADYGLLEMDENDNSFPWGLIHHNELANMLNNGLGKTMVIDSRSFLEYNTSTIQQAVNICCSKLVKRRLQQDKVQILDLLNQTCNIDADASWDVIVYDQCTEDPSQLTADNFVQVLLRKLSTTFNSVAFLKGGFLAFQASHWNLLENKSSPYRCATLTSLSQPCMPVSNMGPTRILPFLYLGCQQDSLDQDLVQVNGITYILNVSKTCPRPSFILENHFYRIPVNDNYCEKLLPHFQEAFQFLDKVREANGCVLVHCLGGVSRSATLAIAYIMKYMKMSSDEAYRYVKDKRPTISPNFNFLGQLLEFEKMIRREKQEEEARRAMRNLDEEQAVSETEKSSFVVMDLHTTNPSSPGSKSAQKSFLLEPSSSLSSHQVSASSPDPDPDCPFPGPTTLNMLPTSKGGHFSSVIQEQGPHMKYVFHQHLGATFDDSPFPRPVSEYNPFQSPPHENCPFPGPLNTTQAEVPSASPARGPHHPVAEQHSSSAHCDKVEGESWPSGMAESPMCRLTGFPSPAEIYQDSPQSTCPRTGFPGPGHYGSMDSLNRAHDDDPSRSESGPFLKHKSTYQHTIKKWSSLSSISPGSLSLSRGQLNEMEDSGSTASNPQNSSKMKHGFSLTSMFSNFKWKCRHPTSLVSSPISPGKDVSRGQVDARAQLTPVSEAIESIDFSPDNVANEGEEERAAVQSSTMEEQGGHLSLAIKQPSNHLTRANHSTMASTLINLSSPPSSSSSSNIAPVQKKMLKTKSVKLDSRKFTLALSSPSSDFPVSFTVSSPHSPQSSGDSNKRKSGFHSSFNSPDKLAKTEAWHQDRLSCSVDQHTKLSPPKTLNLSLSPGDTTRLKPANHPSTLHISSPTAAMARLNFASPSDPTPAIYSYVAAKSIGMEETFSETCQAQKLSHGVCEPESKPTPASSTDSRKTYSESVADVLKSFSPAEHSSPQSELSESRTSCLSLTDGSQSSTRSSSSHSLMSSLSKSSMSWSSSSATSEMSSKEMTSSSASASVSKGLKSLGDFPTTSLDKLSFTPCYIRDIVQELKNQESFKEASGDQAHLSDDVNAASSALDSPMSISSGSSAPSLASSTLSPVESSMANPFSDTGASHSRMLTEPSAQFFPHRERPLSSSDLKHDPEDSRMAEQDSNLSPSSDGIMSPSFMPQATVSPSAPAFSPSFYSNCSSLDPMSPMSLSDSSCCSPNLSPTCNGNSSFPLSASNSPVSSRCSSSVVSPSISPLINSPMSSCAYLASTTTSVSSAFATSALVSSSASTKVVLRRDRGKRVMARPNSIAFSSYPTCDLIPEVGEHSLGTSGIQSSHDDASEAYMAVSGKRSRPSLSTEPPTSRGRTSWGGYSEREVYRQISAAMENAMLQTRAYTSGSPRHGGKSGRAGVCSRKTRSLDNILDSNAEEGQGSRQYHDPFLHQPLYEQYHCGLRSGSEPYQSSSSLSSNGSHGSIHTSLEVIQVS